MSKPLAALLADVPGVGYGLEERGGAREKKPAHRFCAAERVPPTVAGVPTGVLELAPARGPRR